MELIIWILAAYGMTQILVYGSIFDTPRDWIKTNSTFFGDLISCVMCTSTWVGFFFSLTFFSPTIELVFIPYSNLFFDGILASYLRQERYGQSTLSLNGLRKTYQVKIMKKVLQYYNLI